VDFPEPEGPHKTSGLAFLGWSPPEEVHPLAAILIARKPAKCVNKCLRKQLSRGR